MSKNSVVGQAQQQFTHPSNPLGVNTGNGFVGQTFGNALFGGPDPLTTMWAQGFSSFMPNSPTPEAPPGAPPTLGASTMDALSNQLQQEVKMRASNTLFTNDLDSGVKTAGTELIGN